MSSAARDLIRELGVEIGVRTAGSPAAAAAAARIASAFRDLGLEPWLEEFTFLGFDAEEPVLAVDGERVAAGPCAYAPPTPADGVSGRLRAAGRFPFIPGVFEVPVLRIEDDDGRELARLYGNPIEGGGAIPFPHLFGTQALGGPAAWVSHADGLRLAGRDGAAVTLWTGGELVPGRRDRNVLARIAGTGDRTVIVCAHFDSVWRGPGPVDNASGVEAVRRIGAALAGRELPGTVLLAAFGAEELGLLGARFHLAEAITRGERSRIAGVVNLDCVAHGRRLDVMASEPLRERAVALVRDLGLDARYRVEVGPPLPGSDHFPFAQAGIPAAAILHFPYPEYHLPSESVELVDPRRLDDAVALGLALVESLLRGV